jgi:cysteinyl-tRNA synthetase
VAERAAARSAKNFARADEIRGLLAAKRVVVEDFKEGSRWRRV